MLLFLKKLKPRHINFMKLLGINIFGEEKNQKPISEPEALDGAEERREPLSTIEITYRICTFRELKTAEYLQLIAYELSVPEETVKKDLNNYLRGIKDDVVCFLEYPYIEEYYRDTYYSFYARKHHDYNRHCFRISFFSKGVTDTNFYNVELNDKFLGYVVLRPTPRRIIGYSFLAPYIMSTSEIATCICKRLISVIGRSVEIVGFPFLSHDGEALSCSENSIILIFDYFSRRYNNYSRALPSRISSLASNNSCRYQPSVGFAPEFAEQVFNNLGMTTRLYTRADNAEGKNNSSEKTIIDPSPKGNSANNSSAKFMTDATSEDDYSLSSEEFEKILHIFVESGVPIYASTHEHAFLIIGRENKLFEQGANLVVMDGNSKPYSIVTNITEIKSLIIPMPDTILLDAHLIKPIRFYEEIERGHSGIKMLKENQCNYIHRIFLTTSRSFKKHIVETNINIDDKKAIVCTTMPKFIWVCESIHRNELKKDTFDIQSEAIGVFDATAYPTESNCLLMAKTYQYLIIPRTDNSKLRHKKYRVSDCNYQLPIFNFNLKGIHTNWQG